MNSGVVCDIALRVLDVQHRLGSAMLACGSRGGSTQIAHTRHSTAIMSDHRRATVHKGRYSPSRLSMQYAVGTRLLLA